MDKKINSRGRCFCRPEFRRRPKKQRTNPSYCPGCNLKVRSTVEAHNAGENHKKIKAHIEKEMLVRLDPDGTRVTITHTLTNRGLWPVELAPWTPTIMNGGGITIIPNEPYIPEADKVLPARPIVVWHYTDLSDPRWTFGNKYIRLRTDGNLEAQLKMGVMNKQGWAAYLRERTLFLKRFPFLEDANYPDYGCNFETYTAGDFMEVESLGPLVKLDPDESTVHLEYWYLFGGVEAGDSEKALEAAITPLVQSTQGV